MHSGKSGKRLDVVARHAASLPITEGGGLDVEVRHDPLTTDAIEGGCVVVRCFAHLSWVAHLIIVHKREIAA